MTVVDTSTAADATAGPAGRRLDRNQDGTLWVVHDSGLPAAELWYSKNNGASWTSGASDVAGATHTALFIDIDDNAHLVWKQSGTGGGRTTSFLYYMRGTPNVGRTSWTWGTARTLTPTGYGPRLDYPDVVAFRNPIAAGWHAIVIFSEDTGSGALDVGITRLDLDGSGAVGAMGSPTTMGMPQNNDGTTFFGQLSSIYAGSGHLYPSIDFNHNGDGKTTVSSAPHLYAAWTAGASGAGKGVRFKKATYSGAGSWTWGTEREIDNTRYRTAATNTWLSCFYDGTRAVIAGWLYTGTQFDLVIHDRDAADTTTTTRAPLTNTSAADTLASGAVTYDTDGNVYVFGRDGSGSSGSRLLNYRKWSRTPATLGSAVLVEGSAPDTPYISARRGTGGVAVDIAYTDGTASPYSVTFQRVLSNVTSTAPATPTATATANNTVGSITVAWVNPTPSGAQPSVTDVDVFRRIGATGTPVRLRAGDPGSSWTDYRPANGVDYRYMVRARGGNGVTADSAWTS